jgi:ribosomal-protein-alanine N-acetyltransferase
MRIEFPPALNYPGIFVRQIERSDLNNWFAYLSISEVVQDTSWNLQSAKDLEQAFQLYESTSITSPKRLAIVDEITGALIGTVGFHTISDVNQSAEIAYDLAPAYWGRGIGTAICREITAWGFQSLNLERVQATVLETNLRSENILKKCGYTFEGLLRSYRFVRGKPGNFKMYSRLRTDK